MLVDRANGAHNPSPHREAFIPAPRARPPRSRGGVGGFSTPLLWARRWAGKRTALRRALQEEATGFAAAAYLETWAGAGAAWALEPPPRFRVMEIGEVE